MKFKNFKNNELKPEIKKVKKQETEKKNIKLKIMLFIQNMGLVKLLNLKK